MQKEDGEKKIAMVMSMLDTIFLQFMVFCVVLIFNNYA